MFSLVISSIELVLNDKRILQSLFLPQAQNVPHKEGQKRFCQLLHKPRSYINRITINGTNLINVIKYLKFSARKINQSGSKSV